MPRKSKGPRLYLRERKGRDPVYVILDGTSETGTGCGADNREQAEKALADYLGRKHRPDWRKGDPDQVAVADVLALYGSERAPALAHPELVGYHMTHLLEHFGGSVCAQIDGGSCRAYVRKRTTGAIGHRAVSEGTARRELETLNAALGYAYKERKISLPIPVSYPAKAPARERWLTRSEAAALLAGAPGIVPVAYDIASRKPAKWGRMHRPVYHVARFILIALYTGTRDDAILNMRWGVNSEGGWFDLDRGVMYRRGLGQRETNKRRPPAPIPDNLVPHLHRWRRITVQGPVEYADRFILKERRGFKRARELGGLGEDVTPHILKHTCATWLLQSGVSTWDVAGYLGTSEAVIRKTYGHHSPHYLSSARTAFLGRKLGASQKKGA